MPLRPLRAGAQDAPALNSEKEKVSYAVGLNLGKQLRTQSIEVDADLLAKGLRDALSGSKPLVTEQEVRAALNRLQVEMNKKRDARHGETLAKNKQEGETFLIENKSKDGVVTLESGLQYKILKAGDGRKPTLDDTVVCHYRGTLIDGTEFDSSYKRKQPATFPVKKIIKGWTEALQLMPVGSRWQLFIPSSLAYGQRGTGRGIGPNSTLVFDVELLSIKDTPGNDARSSQGKDAMPLAVSFRLDPRLTGSLYMGDRWVSPPTYTRVGEGGSVTVEAKVHDRARRGQPAIVKPLWISADPEMVTVTPNEGHEVKITVKRAGQSSLQVAAQGVSRELAIKATDQGNTLQVEIVQGP